MQPSRENEEAKKNTLKVGSKKTISPKAQNSLRQPVTKPSQPSLQAVPASSMGPVLTQEEYRARVARIAFELYEKRRALTEMDDWIEAERLVKLQLLEEQRGLSV